MPDGFPQIEFLADNHSFADRLLAQMPWQPHFSSETDAALLELSRINAKKDHASAGVEYNAMVGQGRFGIQHSDVHRSGVDNPKASNDANWGAIGDLGGALPDVMIHSHPIQEATGPDGKQQVRPWWFFSPTDVATQEQVGQNFGTKIQGYILEPQGEVLSWKKGDETIQSKDGQVWGKPTILGKFDAEGSFVPLKKPEIFDHLHPPAASAYDPAHKITPATFQQWEEGHYRNTPPPHKLIPLGE